MHPSLSLVSSPFSVFLSSLSPALVVWELNCSNCSLYILCVSNSTKYFNIALYPKEILLRLSVEGTFVRSKSESIHLPLHSEYSAKSQIIHIHRGYICNVYFKKEVLEKFAFQKKNFRQIKRTAYKFFFREEIGDLSANAQFMKMKSVANEAIWK